MSRTHKTFGYVQSPAGHVFSIEIEADRHEIHGADWRLLQIAEGSEAEALADLDEEGRAEAVEALLAPDSRGFYGFASEVEGRAWAEGRRRRAA